MINQPQPLSHEAHPPPRRNHRSWLVEPSSNRRALDSPAPAQSGSDSQEWKRGSVFRLRMMGPFSSNFSTHSIMVIFISIIISFIITRTKVDQCRNRWTNFCLLGFPKSLTMTKVFFRDLTGQLKSRSKNIWHMVVVLYHLQNTAYLCRYWLSTISWPGQLYDSFRG